MANRPSNFRMQAPAGDLRSVVIEGEASPAAPDPERSAQMPMVGVEFPGQGLVTSTLEPQP